MTFNIVGDIHGNYLTLRALLDKMPKDAKLFAVGDMIDRGPRSKDVIEYVMTHGLAVLGNHEHFMMDALEHPMPTDLGFYEHGVWGMNGGLETIASYLGRRPIPGEGYNAFLIEFTQHVPLPHVRWLHSLPYCFEHPGLFISHAPRNPSLSLEQCEDTGKSANSLRLDTSLLWNRGNPRAMHNTLQVYGHMAYRAVLQHENESGVWGVCVDTYRAKKLTGLHWPSMEIFEQEVIDK